MPAQSDGSRRYDCGFRQAPEPGFDAAHNSTAIHQLGRADRGTPHAARITAPGALVTWRLGLA